jgi:hypothetical protein
MLYRHRNSTDKIRKLCTEVPVQAKCCHTAVGAKSSQHSYQESFCVQAAFSRNTLRGALGIAQCLQSQVLLVSGASMLRGQEEGFGIFRL